MSSANQTLNVIRGACAHDCPDTCSWIVEVENGKAGRLYGNPEHPFTRGSLCGKVNHYLDRVYHPDRVLHPLKRVGRKGEGKFERVSWETALGEVAEKWNRIIRESGAESILPYSLAGNQGLIQMASLDRRLFALLGCSNLERAICGDVAGIGLAETNGKPYGVDPEELVHSRYIILWGTNTIVTNMHMWPVIAEARKRGAKIVVIDPIKTRTAEQADWHLAPMPGSDPAMMLAMMHVIVRENLVDLDFVRRYSHGYDQLVERVQEYSPESVESVTGISAADIEKLAREYAQAKPSMIRPLIGPEHHRNGAMFFRTIACLPILTGAWRHRGGGLSRSTGSLQSSTLNVDRLEMPELRQPNVRTMNMANLGNDLCSKDLNPPIRSLCIWNVNPVVTVPNQQRIIQGLMREDLFTIVHDLFVTDTARYADFVFPATSQIEHLDIVPAWGHHYLSLNRPAIEPLGESVCNTEFFRRLAMTMGRKETCLFDSDESLIRTALDSGHPWMEGITFERLWNDGFARLNHDLDWRPYANGFLTPNGKANLWSDSLQQRGLDPLPAPGEIRTGNNGQLQLITGKTLFFLNSSYGNLERHTRREGPLYVEINAADAETRLLNDGDSVEVFNEYGSVIANCQISDRVRPGIAWMPFGAWTSLNAAASDLGNAGDAVPCSVNALTPVEPTDWGGGSGFYDAFVDVRKTRLSTPKDSGAKSEEFAATRD